MRNLMGIVALGIVACGGPTASPPQDMNSKPTAPSSLSGFQEVSVDELAAAIEAGGVQLIDVRTRGEWESGHVAAARWVALDELSLTDPRVAQLDKSKPVYLICASGRRSAVAAQSFASGGWTALNVTGGTRAWVDSGRAVE
jgi:rhodanese-related sulfurtransferase